MKLLIVDDSKTMCEFIKDIIEFCFTFDGILIVHDGVDAISTQFEENCDIILMDITMEIIGGIQATQIIKEQDDMVEIIICSSLSEKQLVKEALECGASDFIVKPVTRKIVREAIQKAIMRLQEKRETL